MNITHTYPKASPYGSAPDEIEELVIARHDKVATIINRHLDEIHAEILRLDCETMNIDGAGDLAEIARQVLTVLVVRLRGFGAGSRGDIQCEQRRLAELPMNLLRDKFNRVMSEERGRRGVPESEMVSVLSEDVDPEVARSLMQYALKHLIGKLCEG